VLITVTSIGLLLAAGVYVLLSVPLASIVATIVDVTMLGRDPTTRKFHGSSSPPRTWRPDPYR